jgi:SLT domain-containing protein
MTRDPLTSRAVELLARAHRLYGHQSYAGSGELLGQAGRPGPYAGTEFAAPATRRTVATLRHAAAADTEAATIPADAGADHTRGRHTSRTILDDAYGDSMPATDTVLGRREALRRMTARLHLQRRSIQRSRRHSLLSARRLRRLDYVHRRRVARASRPSAAGPLPLGAVCYEHSRRPSNRTTEYICAALDHLGITEPAARRNWLHGYQTLITRESGGRPSAVASEPATEPGPLQSDGHRLGYARGITQTIPATFARYHQPGTSNSIYDPVANICASMNYVIHRYGVAADGHNLIALVQQADARRAPKGY